jgi:hypothetical protein
LAAVGLGTAGWLNASLVQVGSSAALGANDSVLWAQLGPVGSEPPATSHFTSTDGLTGTVVSATAGGVQGAPALNDNTLYHLTTSPVYDSNYDDHQVTVNFDSPVFGVGVLMMNDFGSTPAFDYHMQVFNSGGSLGTINVASPQVVNTPSYVGVLDSTQEITKVVFSTDGFGANTGDYFALDTLNLKDAVGQTAPGVPNQGPSVPEPSSLTLAGIGLALAGAGLRHRGVRKSS